LRAFGSAYLTTMEAARRRSSHSQHQNRHLNDSQQNQHPDSLDSSLAPISSSASALHSHHHPGGAVGGSAGDRAAVSSDRWSEIGVVSMPQLMLDCLPQLQSKQRTLCHHLYSYIRKKQINAQQLQPTGSSNGGGGIGGLPAGNSRAVGEVFSSTSSSTQSMDYCYVYSIVDRRIDVFNLWNNLLSGFRSLVEENQSSLSTSTNLLSSGLFRILYFGQRWSKEG